MQLIHLADFGGAHPGSFIAALRSIGAEARRRNWDFRIAFSPVAQGREWLDLLRPFPVDFVHPRDTSTYLSQVVQEPAIIHTHFSSFDLPVAKMPQWHGSRIDIYWHIHSVPPRTTRARIRNTVRFGWYARRIRGILCVSPEVATVVRRRLGRNASYLHNAIDTDLFAPAAHDFRRESRLRLGIESNDPVYLHFGRAWHLKGGDLFLSALSSLEHGTALCVGGGELAHAESRRLGIEHRVKVVEPTPDVQRLYAASDVFVSSSRSEGMPFSVLEALSSGLPVALTPISGHRVIAGSGAPACFEAKSLHAEDLAQALASASKAPSDPDSLHQWSVENVDIRPWAVNLIDRYTSSTGNRSRKQSNRGKSKEKLRGDD